MGRTNDGIGEPSVADRDQWDKDYEEGLEKLRSQPDKEEEEEDKEHDDARDI